MLQGSNSHDAVALLFNKCLLDFVNIQNRSNKPSYHFLDDLFADIIHEWNTAVNELIPGV